VIRLPAGVCRWSAFGESTTPKGPTPDSASTTRHQAQDYGDARQDERAEGQRAGGLHGPSTRRGPVLACQRRRVVRAFESASPSPVETDLDTSSSSPRRSWQSPRA
jgi:hypothetical protein